MSTPKKTQKCAIVKNGYLCSKGSDCQFSHNIRQMDKKLYIDEIFTIVSHISQNMDKIKTSAAYTVQKIDQLEAKVNSIAEDISSINMKLTIFATRLKNLDDKIYKDKSLARR